MTSWVVRRCCHSSHTANGSTLPPLRLSAVNWSFVPRHRHSWSLLVGCCRCSRYLLENHSRNPTGHVCHSAETGRMFSVFFPRCFPSPCPPRNECCWVWSGCFRASMSLSACFQLPQKESCSRNAVKQQLVLRMRSPEESRNDTLFCLALPRKPFIFPSTPWRFDTGLVCFEFGNSVVVLLFGSEIWHFLIWSPLSFPSHFSSVICSAREHSLGSEPPCRACYGGELIWATHVWERAALEGLMKRGCCCCCCCGMT